MICRTCKGARSIPCPDPGCDGGRAHCCEGERAEPMPSADDQLTVLLGEALDALDEAMSYVPWTTRRRLRETMGRVRWTAFGR